MDRKIIALSSGDWHFHNWAQFNVNDVRIKTSMEFLTDLVKRANYLQVPIIFTGDFGHTPEGLSTKVFNHVSLLLRHLSDKYNVEIWGISGNHDMSEVNTPDQTSPSIFMGLCSAFPKLMKSLEYQKKSLKGSSVNFFGIPYLTHNVGLSDLVKSISREADASSDRGYRNVLVIHSDIWGARDPSGREVNTVENIPRNLGKFFKSFDLVLSGHIHRFEELWGNHVYMVGAPYQQRKSDMGCDMGYVEIYSDLSVGFVPYEAPIFREYREGEPHPNNGDYWIRIPKKTDREKKEVKVFSPNMNRSKMARRYAEQSGIKNKSKISALIDALEKIDDYE